MNKPTQQQVVEAYKKLPPPVREFLADPDQLAQVLTDMKNTHNLHVDVIGQVSESIGYFLLGLASSNELKDALKATGVSEGTINEIISEINQKIFVPLREEMRKTVVSQQGNQQPSKPAVPVTATRPMGVSSAPSAMPARQPVTATAPAAGAGQPTSHFHLENKLPPPPRPAENTAVRPIPPRPSAQVPVAASALSAPVPVLPQQTIKPIPAQSNPINILNTEAEPPQQIPVPVRPSVSNIAPLPPKVVLPRAVGAGFRPVAPTILTPTSPKATQGTAIDSNKLLEDHKEPHIELNKSKAPSSSEGTPLQQALRTVLPPPPNLPGAMPPPDIMLQPRSAFAASKVPQTPVKPYSADPYREPIE